MGCVDMQPQTLARTEVGDRFDRIEATGCGAAGVDYDRDGPTPRAVCCVQCPAERLGVCLVALVGSDRSSPTLSPTHQGNTARDAVVRLVRDQHGKRRTAVRTVVPDIESGAGLARGKQPLRAIYDLYPDALPALIRDRRKIQFDEGAGIASEEAGWSALFEDAVTDGELQDGKKEFAGFDIASKEELFYLRALSRGMDVSRVSHLKSRTRLYVPQNTEAMPEAMKKLRPAGA